MFAVSKFLGVLVCSRSGPGCGMVCTCMVGELNSFIFALNTFSQAGFSSLSTVE